MVGEGTIPFLIEGRAGEYLQTISRFARTLEVDTIIPGHAAPTTGAIFDRYLSYLSGLIRSVRSATRAGQSLQQTLDNNPLGPQYALPELLMSQVGPLINGFHLWNVQVTYRELKGQ